MPAGQTASTPMLGVTRSNTLMNLISSKLNTLCYIPSGKDGIILCSFVFNKIQRVTERRTETI